jgi:hypothetical protein
VNCKMNAHYLAVFHSQFAILNSQFEVRAFQFSIFNFQFFLKASLVCLLLMFGMLGCQSPEGEATASVDGGVVAEIPPEPEAEKVGTFEGRYTSGFETSSFEPCAFADERWWVGENLEPVEDFLRASGRDPIRQQSTVFVKWAGRAGPLGKHGYMAGYQREFTIQKVQEIRAVLDSDCPQAKD